MVSNYIVNNMCCLEFIVCLDGDTPLNIAIRMGYYLCFATLCRNKADVNKDHKKDGYTPLRMAVERSDVKMVKFLLNNTNADATIGDFRNILPITAALVLQEPTKPETQEVYALLEQHMVIRQVLAVLSFSLSSCRF